QNGLERRPVGGGPAREDAVAPDGEKVRGKRVSSIDRQRTRPVAPALAVHQPVARRQSLCGQARAEQCERAGPQILVDRKRVAPGEPRSHRGESRGPEPRGTMVLAWLLQPIACEDATELRRHLG